MHLKTLFRLIAAPMMMLALTAAFASTAMAGGGGTPTGPTVNLSPRSLARRRGWGSGDHDGPLLG